LSRPLLKLGATFVASAALAVPAFASAAVSSSITHGFVSAVASPAADGRPTARQGYHLAFKEDFGHFRKRVWTRKIWYDDPPPRHAVFAKGGALHLVSRRSQGYKNVTATTMKSRSFRRGYLEARMKWKGVGAWPAFWLTSKRHATNPAWPNINPYCANHGLRLSLCWASELDVFEGQGTEPRVFYGTLHRDTNNWYGATDATNDGYHPVRKNLTRGFHRYGALWTASRITWYLDGKKLMSAPTYRSTDQPMFLILQMWTGGWANPGDKTTWANSLETTVDWVKVWRQ